MPSNAQDIDDAVWEHIARFIGDIYNGNDLTRFFNESGLKDVQYNGYTKWRRIVDAIHAELRKTHDLEKVFSFIEACLNPVRFIQRKPSFPKAKESINEALTHAGYRLNDAGKIIASDGVDAKQAVGLQPQQALSARPLWSPPASDPQPDECFILMPFDDDLTQVYLELVKPAIEETGMRVKRADDIRGNAAVMQDIWESICNSGIIVADLTRRNPNVFYELGIAHTVGRPTILIAQEEEHSIPFDIRHIRQIQYANTAVGGATLAKELKETIDEVRRRASLSEG